MLTQESHLEALLESPKLGSYATQSLGLCVMELSGERIVDLLNGMKGLREFELNDVDCDDTVGFAVLSHPALNGMPRSSFFGSCMRGR